MAAYTIADIIKLRDQRIAGLIDDATKSYPLVATIPAIAVSGTTYNHPNISADPAGSFRTENAGKTATKATINSQSVTLKYWDASMGPLDVQVAKADHNGPENAITLATSSALRGGMAGLEKQIIYGTDATFGDTAGFVGFFQLIDSTMKVDAGGTLTGAGTSVWLVNYEQTKLILGNDGTIAQDDVVFGPAFDGDGKQFFAYSQNIGGWSALTGLRINGLAQIHGLDTVKTLDDDLIYDALSLFKVGHAPNAIVMSRRSMKQLRASRTATNGTGAPAPLVTEVEGLPVMITDTILDTEDAAA